MEPPPQQRTRHLVLWLLIASSLLMSIAAFIASRPQHSAELERLDAQARQLETDLAKLETDLEKLKAEAAKRQQNPEGVVNTPGTYSFFDGKLTLTVADEGGGLNYRVKRVYEEGPTRDQSVGPAEPFFKDRDHWFVCVESADSVWIFDGQDVLEQDEFNHGSVKMKDSNVLPDIVRTAPEAVRDHLPQSFLEKFKDEAPSGGTTPGTE